MTSKPILCVGSTGRALGKTSLLCALARHVRTQGGLPAVIKPIETSCTYSEKHDLVGRDGERLREARGHPMPPLVSSPYRFPSTKAPVEAAAASGISLGPDAIVSAIETAAEFGDVVLVEIPWTISTPLTESFDGIDLVQQLAAKLLVIADEDPIPSRAKPSLVLRQIPPQDELDDFVKAQDTLRSCFRV